VTDRVIESVFVCFAAASSVAVVWSSFSILKKERRKNKYTKWSEQIGLLQFLFFSLLLPYDKISGKIYARANAKNM